MSRLEGQVAFDASINRAKNAMSNPVYLERFLTVESHIEKIDATTFNFTVVKDVGLLTAKMTGILTVTPNEADSTVRFLARAKHLIAGSIEIDMTIHFAGDRQHCVMTYSGNADATGLLGALLAQNEEIASYRIEAAFTELGRVLTKNQKSFEARLKAERTVS